MASELRHLVDVRMFNILEQKLDRWYRDYHVNSVDQNVAIGCEIIELNARVQGQLFNLLSICANEGGLYGGASGIKSRLLPLLGNSFFASGLSSKTSLEILEQATSGGYELALVKRRYEESLGALEDDLRVKNRENADLKQELEDVRIENERLQRESVSDKMFSERETGDLRTQLRLAEAECDRLRHRLLLAGDYVGSAPTSRVPEVTFRSESPLRRSPIPLPLPVPAITNGSLALSPGSPRPATIEPLADGLSTRRALPRVGVTAYLNDPLMRVRQQNLVSRFGDLFLIRRLDSIDLMRRFGLDYETMQRIVYSSAVESFKVAQSYFRDWKLRVRNSLVTTHFGPESLEAATQDYINRHVESIAEVDAIIPQVILALKRNVKLRFPLDFDFSVLHLFIRECVRVAWEMSALPAPIDVGTGFEGELFDEHKYRRTVESEYTAPLVAYYVWPYLAQDGHVILKGEAVTKLGASSHYSRPISGAYLDGVAEAVSARRSGSPLRGLGYLSAAASAISTPRARSPSPTRRSALATPRSVSPRSVTARSASTSLSHYLTSD